MVTELQQISRSIMGAHEFVSHFTYIAPFMKAGDSKRAENLGQISGFFTPSP